MQIQNCDDVKLLQKLCMDNIDLLVECGFNKSLSKLNLEDKITIVQSICLQMVVLNTLAEIQQFMDGFGSLGVAKAVQEHPSLLWSFYCSANVMELTSGKQIYGSYYNSCNECFC